MYVSNISAIRAEKIPRSDLAIAFTFLNFIKIHPRSFRFAGTLPLRRKALEAVLPPGGYGKAHHMGAAACDAGAARKAGQPEDLADRVWNAYKSEKTYLLSYYCVKLR